MHSPAWLLLGLSSVPGELRLRGGTLTFTATGTGSAWPGQLRKLERRLGTPGLAGAIDAGERVDVFSWPAADIHAVCPWYYFGGGLHLSHGSIRLRLSFGAPANTDEVSSNLSEIGTMRRRGRLWQAVLAQITASPTDGERS